MIQTKSFKKALPIAAVASALMVVISLAYFRSIFMDHSDENKPPAVIQLATGQDSTTGISSLPEEAFTDDIHSAEIDVEIGRIKNLEVSKHDAAIRAVLNRARKLPFPERFRIALELSESSIRLTEIGGLSLEWSNRSPEDLYDFAASNLTGVLKGAAQYHAMQSMLEMGNMERSKQMLEGMPVGDSRLRGFRTLGNKWSQNSPNAAYEWMKTLEGMEKERALAGIVSAVMESEGPRGVIRFLDERTSRSVLSQAAYAGVPIALKQRGLDGAIEFVNAFPKVGRDMVLSAIIDRIPIEETTRWDELMDLATTPSEKRTVASSMAYRLSTKDPVTAANWSIQLPNEMRGHALGTVISNWGRQDYGQMMKWIEAMPAGLDRNQAIDMALTHHQQLHKAGDVIRLKGLISKAKP